MISLTGDVYYHGYWIGAEWFKSIEKTVLAELVFPEITDHQNKAYLEKIQNTESCSIHIRRGDYVDLGFSDDMYYCRSHMCEMGLDLPKETVFVEGNRKESAFRDMQLMSHCKYMIYANSSFSFLAALLNQDLNGYISPEYRRL